ncbi:MAG: DNA circularization N-terminal domain-containing protein [Burkholderiales bacterium]|nr:DNA circularization N-terminal domain-containing protein [Burkholderiales bacterium]
MTWYTDEGPNASFRGVRFHVLANDSAVGRRGALHEYPGRDEPWLEDLGRRARQWTLDAVVLGSDYAAQRDRLIAAVEQPGPGPLVHPQCGLVQASVLDCRISESTQAQLVARFTLTFVEAGKSSEPRRMASTRDQVAQAGQVVETAAAAEFEGVVVTRGLPDFVATSLRSRVAGLVTQVRGLAAGLTTALAPLAELQQQIDGLNAGLVALSYEPAAMANRVTTMLRQLTRSVTQQPADALRLAKVLWGYGRLGVSTAGVSPRRATEIGNRMALARLVRSTAVVEAARAISELGFGSFDEAQLLRDEYAAACDELLLAGVADAHFSALRALRSTVVADITLRGADLARLVRWTPAQSMPVLVLAQALYGDGTRADDVLARNAKRIRHPLFAAGGVALEVLANA